MHGGNGTGNKILYAGDRSIRITDKEMRPGFGGRRLDLDYMEHL
jgi:hypothetical protein